MSSDAAVGRSGLASTLWKYRWTLLLPLALASAATGVVAYAMPARYASAAIVEIIPAAITAGYERAVPGPPMDLIVEQIASRSRLERVIKDLDLYPEDREHMLMEDVIQRIRRGLTIEPLAGLETTDQPRRRYSIQFEAEDPRTALRVAERMTQLVLEANLRHRAALAEGTTQFLIAQKEAVASQIDEHEKAMARQRASSGGASVPRAMQLEQEVLEDTYRTLATRLQQTALAKSLEARNLGEQLRLVDPPRLPTEPVGPDRLMVSLAGPAFGLVIGLGLVLASSRRARG